MPEILVTVRDKFAENTLRHIYVCSNSDYQIRFDFDAEWEAYQIKTAHFKYGSAYQDVVFTGNVCYMPVIEDAAVIYVGVYAGDLCTTTAAIIRSFPSILSGNGVPADPPPDVYTQIMTKIDSGVLQGPEGKSAYQIALANGFVGTEIQWLESLKGAPGDTTAADAAAEAAKKAAQEAKKAAETAVLYTEQHLTDSQQEQARSNINAADGARQNVLVGTETGNPIAVDDAFAAPLCGLTVYGKSTQDGTPSPDNPVPIVSAGDGGTIVVTLSDGNGKTQTLTLPTPNGLPGIPVTSGGNYTDQTGQQWVCDEVDLERGVKVQRINKVEVDGENVKFVQVDKYCNLKLNGLPNAAYIAGQRTNAIATFTNAAFFFNASNGNFLYLIVENIADQLNDSCKKKLGKIYYHLATPIETPLTPAELAAYKALTTYAPDTVAQASDGAGVKLDYQRDVNIVIKKLEDAIASITAT